MCEEPAGFLLEGGSKQRAQGEVFHTNLANVRLYPPLRSVNFTAAAILTLQSPNRTLNPHDLRVWRVRWPALVCFCTGMIFITSSLRLSPQKESTIWYSLMLRLWR